MLQLFIVQANCILHSSQELTRDQSISTEHMEDIVQNDLPEYMLLDILASLHDYQTGENGHSLLGDFLLYISILFWFIVSLLPWCNITEYFPNG